MKLRKFVLKDLAQVLAISKETFAESWTEKEFRNLQNTDGFIVAEENDEIAGFIVAGISNNEGLLKLIAVNSGYRGKGVGKSLLESIFSYFKGNGIKEVIAHSRLHNQTGCAFLKSFGFEATETVKSYYRNGEDAYLMVKTL